MRPIALTRAVPDSFADALVTGERPAINVTAARRQHEAYRSLLAAAGYEVIVIPADEAHPDCPFVEDAAVALDTLAVITRPGAEARRGETGPVAVAIAGYREVRRIDPPGTLDGGDVLRMGSQLFVGRSSRTNDAGIAQLTPIAAEDGLKVTSVPVSGVLHLKSAVAAIDPETLLIAPECVEAGVFADYRLIEKAPGEAHLASVLQLRGGVVAMTTTAPETLGRVQAAGFDPLPVDSSEFQAADGGLTCLSILLDS